MQQDQLQAIWARQDAKLDECLSLQTQLLEEQTRDRARASLSPHVWGYGLKLVGYLAALIFLGSFAVEHAGEPRLVAAAVCLHVYMIGLLGLATYEVLLISRLDHQAPVIALMRAVEQVQLAEYRSFKWALLGGVLLWSLVPLVASKAAGGPDLLEQVPLVWFGANAALGLACLVTGQWWSRRHVERPDARPWARRFVEHLSGRSLRTAKAALGELVSFEREEG